MEKLLKSNTLMKIGFWKFRKFRMKIMENRWCESCNCKCESTRCIEENACGQILDGNPNCISSEQFQKSKMYNDYQLKIFAEKRSKESRIEEEY